MSNITLFSQIVNKLNRQKFKKIVDKYNSDKHNKGINSWTHLVSMLYLHFAKANSLSEVSNGLRLSGGNLNHLGIMQKVPQKSSLSYINQHRNWEIFREFFYKLLEEIESECNFGKKRFKVRLKKKIYALDSTVISLCLSLYDWAKYRTKKGAIKLHTLLDYDGCLPVYVNITDGKVSDNKAAYDIVIPKGSVVVGDRAYVDSKLLWQWDQNKINFVVRLKKNIKYIPYEERPLPENKHLNILKDEVILLMENKTRKEYPKKLRRVVVYDEVNEVTLELITNNFSWTAYTISDLYKRRWDIEVFFKELKNHLKIKSFVGTNENAVMIQIWTALISYLLVRYLKSISKFGWSLSNLIAAMRGCLFLKIELRGFLDEPFKPPGEIITDGKQCFLFEG
jgi:hypothetical protein